MEIFALPSDRLAEIYKALKCDGCGALLQATPVTIWVKAGCGYYCADCHVLGVYMRRGTALAR